MALLQWNALAGNRWHWRRHCMTLSNQLKWHLSAIHSPIVDGLPLCKREIKINPHKCQDNSMGERRYIVCYVVIKKKKNTTGAGSMAQW